MKWSVPIITVALCACILMGSLGFEDTVKETTEYTSVLSDLTPIVEADAVTENVNYNPLTNVNGWSSNVSYETQTAASLYKVQTDYSWTAGTSGALSSMGDYVLEPTVVSNYYSWKWSNGDTVGATAPGTVIGGWSGYLSHYPISGSDGFYMEIIDSSIYATLDVEDEDPGTSYSYARVLNGYDIPNNSVVTSAATNGGVVALATTLPGSWSYTHENNGTQYIIDKQVARLSLGTYQSISSDYFFKDGLFYRISGYDADGAPQVEYGTAYSLALLSNDLNSTFSWNTLNSSTTYYIKPYTMASLPSGASTWRNGYDNTTVQILADANGLNFAINGGSAPAAALSDSQPDMAAWISGYTGKILITINSDGTSYWQGVTAYSNTKEYTVADYHYSLTASGNVTTSPITSVTLYYLNSTSGEAAVVETWMAQDSGGLLWQDATFPIDTVFSSIWTTENMRVSFNSFVTTGTSLTINGQSYAVDDNGFITIGDSSFKLAGSSIEWLPGGETTFVAPNGDSYDLGQRSGTFTLDGVWYGVISLDTFEIINAPAKEAIFGMIPDVTWLAWIFTGVLTIGTIALLATGRQLDTVDLLALITFGLIGIIMAVVL